MGLFFAMYGMSLFDLTAVAAAAFVRSFNICICIQIHAYVQRFREPDQKVHGYCLFKFKSLPKRIRKFNYSTRKLWKNLALDRLDVVGYGVSGRERPIDRSNFPEPVNLLVAKRMQAIHMEIRWTTTHVRRRRPVHDIQLTGGAVQLMHKYKWTRTRDRALGSTRLCGNTVRLLFGCYISTTNIFTWILCIYQSV